MVDRKQLPFLLKLLDDETASVRETVLRELEAFGPDLDKEIVKLGVSLDKKRESLLRGILEIQARTWIREGWGAWRRKRADLDRLEAALNLLSQFQCGRRDPKRLEGLLDRLAKEYSRSVRRADSMELSRFLFQTSGLQGNSENYHDPQNSNLAHVIEEGRGIPISLACVFILVGKRLGVTVEACNFPGHFLARIYRNDRPVFIDCFDKGKILDEKKLVGMNLEAFPNIEEILVAKTPARAIVARVLRNLTGAYGQAGEEENHDLMEDLLRETEKAR